MSHESSFARLDLPARLSLGVLAGAALGTVGGLAEAGLRPLAEPLRIPYVAGADGLVGAVWGFVVALFLRRRGRDTATALVTILAFGVGPALAVGLGLWANRTLLTRANFLSPVSLAMDVVCLAVAAAGAALLARGAERILARRGMTVVPHPLSALVVLVLLSAAVFVPPRLVVTSRTAALPPVIVVSIDTLRPDRLSGGGEPQPTSPHLDRLFRQGRLWSEALTPSPGSAAGHAALLSSRYPVSNGVWRNFAVLDESVETLAERLHAAGYRTGGFVTNTFLGRRFGFAQGFDVYVESGVTERLEEPSGAGLRRSLALVQIADRIRYRLDPRRDPSFESALSWLKESERPAFLFLHFMDVHAPYVPPRPWGDRFGATPDGEPGSPDHRNKFGWRPSTAAYLGEIAWVDAKVGRLTRALAARGMLDTGVLILTSDHGENLLDHEPNFTHGSTLYESTLRILAAMRAPGRMEAGVVDPRVFENVDFLPTLYDVLDVAPSEAWEGRDFTGGDVPELPATIGQIDLDFAVRTPDWKAIFHDGGARELYRLDTDPGETRVAPPDSALGEWQRIRATPLYTEARSVSPEELSPAVREKLRSLGYQN